MVGALLLVGFFSVVLGCPCVSEATCEGWLLCAGPDYRGWKNTSLTGKSCLPWAQSQYKNFSWLGFDSNYCRAARKDNGDSASLDVSCNTASGLESCDIYPCGSPAHLAQTCTSSCETFYEESVCRPYLNYSIVYVSSNTYQQEINQWFIRYWWFWDMLSTPCKHSVMDYLCKSKYPQCASQTNPQGIYACQSTCASIQAHCNATDVYKLISVGFDLPGHPSPEPFSTDYLQYMSSRNIIHDPLFNLTETCSAMPTTNCLDPIDPTRLPPIEPLLRCERYKGTLCGDLFPPGYRVMVSPQLDMAAMEELFSGPIGLLSALSPTCQPNIYEWVCSSLYPPCNDILSGMDSSLAVVPEFPSLPCRALCDDLTVKCPAVLTNPYLQEIAALFTCDTKSWYFRILLNTTMKYDPLLEWSRSVSNNWFIYGSEVFGSWKGQSIRAPCKYFNLSELVGYNTCPHPTVHVPSLSDSSGAEYVSPGFECAYPCPRLWYWTESTWDSAQSIMYLTIPSFMFSTFLLLTWIIFPTKRNQSYVLWFIVCVWVTTMSLVFGFAAPEAKQHLRNLPCKSPVSGTSMSDGLYCGFQALMMFYFMLATAWWWFFIAFDVYHRANKKGVKINPRIYHSIAWGCPLLCLIIFLAAGGELGGSRKHTLMFCFIREAPEWLEYLTWYCPIMLIAIAGMVMILLLIRQIYSARKAIRSSTHTMNSSASSDLNLYLRPILFVLSFWAVLFWLFVFRVEWSSKAQKIQDDEFKFIDLLTREILGQDVINPYKGTLFVHPTEWIWYGLHLFLALQGIVMVLTWGTQSDNLLLWKELIINKALLRKDESSKASRTSNIEKADLELPSAKRESKSQSNFNLSPAPDEQLPDENATES